MKNTLQSLFCVKQNWNLQRAMGCHLSVSSFGVLHAGGDLGLVLFFTQQSLLSSVSPEMHTGLTGVGKLSTVVGCSFYLGKIARTNLKNKQSYTNCHHNSHLHPRRTSTFDGFPFSRTEQGIKLTPTQMYTQTDRHAHAFRSQFSSERNVSIPI